MNTNSIIIIKFPHPPAEFEKSFDVGGFDQAPQRGTVDVTASVIALI